MNWVVFIYKVPSQPTKYRAFLWREIKRLGAIYLQDGVCILPDTDDVQLFIGSLAEKVNEFGGQEYSFLSSTFSKEQNENLVNQFNSARNEEYKELIPWVQRIMEYFQVEEDWEFSDSQVQKVRDDFKKLQRQFQVIEARDYFEADAGRQLRLMLNQCRKSLTQHF
jgi:hypothetical protein